ncbi:MAG: hypothetical protein RDU24_08050 [Humidesulfovibrio sp.]|uniref:hypothetical protein n=1 Tax=Humidesulfovibrio sp. TaxID=2910988 RepID=UPI0027E8B25B|nr:hypothetical protein [Humidesulfovibrio sp.]MDQ7835320.1 hypothetical protein [Humidesulfovibrio sp.]
MQRIHLLPLALLLSLSVCLAGCGDPVEHVRQARISPDPSMTVAEALEKYPYFTKVQWSSFEDKDGKLMVQAECDIDVAANCRTVSETSLAAATRDVRRDYLQARFVVEGFPRKVRAMEAAHVTVCSNGKPLRLADPKYLRAIYSRELVRFFCLEGLNCPPGPAK